MLEEKISFLEKPFFVDDTAEVLVVAKLFVEGDYILNKLREFAERKKAEAKDQGYDAEDCNNCNKAIFDLQNIKGQQYLLIRASCLVREKFKIEEVICLLEMEI